MSQYNFYNMRYKKTNSVDIKNFRHTVSKFSDNFDTKDEIRKEFKGYNDDFNKDYNSLKKIQKARQEKLPQTKDEFHDLRKLYKAIDYKIPNMKKNLFENSSLLIKNNMLRIYFMFKKQDNTLVNELGFLDRIHDEAFDRIYDSHHIEENTRKKTNLNQYKRLESLDIDNIALEIRKNEKEMARIKDNMKETHLDSDRNLNILGDKSTKSILYKSTRSIGSTTFMSKNSNDASTLNTMANNKLYNRELKKIVPKIKPINNKKNIKLAFFKADKEEAEQNSSTRKKTSDFNFFRKGLGLTVAENIKNNNHQSNIVNSIDFDKRNCELESLYEKFSKKEGDSSRADAIYKYLLEYTDKKNLTSRSFSPGDIIKNINEIKSKISNIDVNQTFSGFNEKSILVSPRLLENINSLDKTINKYEYDLIKYLNYRK